jgi:4-hydroxybenzoate polyprenyltransferase
LVTTAGATRFYHRDMTRSRSRYLLIAGLILMIAGILDPLEGSVVVLAGGAAAALGAYYGRAARFTIIATSFVMILIGVAALFGFSALGGVGGNSGRSIWWILTMAPYPIGWVIEIIATVSAIRSDRTATA